jgi:hypothetical protein
VGNLDTLKAGLQARALSYYATDTVTLANINVTIDEYIAARTLYATLSGAALSSYGIQGRSASRRAVSDAERQVRTLEGQLAAWGVFDIPPCVFKIDMRGAQP